MRRIDVNQRPITLNKRIVDEGTIEIRLESTCCLKPSLFVVDGIGASRVRARANFNFDREAHDCVILVTFHHSYAPLSLVLLL